MYDLREELEKLCKRTTKEIHDLNKRLEANENMMAPSDVDISDKLSHTIKSIKKVLALLDETDMENQNRGYSGSYMRQPMWDNKYGYSGNSYNGTYTLRTGDDYSGRHMPRYSRGTEKNDMIMRLEDMMSRARDTREADAIRETIEAIHRD